MPKTKPITKAKARAIAKAKAQQKEKRKKLITAGVIGLGVIILLIVFLTRPENAVKQAKEFFALLGEDRISDAYQSTSRAFQDSQSEDDFKAMVEDNKLNQFTSVTWAKPNIANDQAKLEGMVITKTGEKMPVQLTLVLVGRQWQVFRLEATSPGIAVTPPGGVPAATTPGTTVPAAGPVASPFGNPSIPIPGDEEMKSLVFDALYNLQRAVNKKDFSPFYGYISAQWQKETSTDDLKKKFQVLIDKKFERAVLIGSRPVFEKSPDVGTDDSITIAGQYPTKPLKVAFELKYVYENSFWKLSAADIKLTEEAGSGPGQLPGRAELSRLVTSTLLALNDAITAKNFAPFYQTLAKQWQQQTTPEKLQVHYQEYIDKKIDFKRISEMGPVFSDQPSLNMDNQFSVSGSYEIKDLTVNFQIPYHFEDSTWKPLPFALGVSMTILENSGTTNP